MFFLYNHNDGGDIGRHHVRCYRPVNLIVAGSAGRLLCRFGKLIIAAAMVAWVVTSHRLSERLRLSLAPGRRSWGSG